MGHTVDYFSSGMEYSSAKKERKSLTIPKNLAKQASVVIKQSNISSLSELVTIALSEYLSKIEKERIMKELAEAYEANYEFDLKMNEEWKFVDVK